MDEEDIESLAVPEKSEIGVTASIKTIAMGKQSSSDKECTSRESSGSGDNKECSRRYSTGKPSSPKRNQKITPNYLRASTGSCHDFCKYGIKHGFDHQDNRPWRKKSALTSSGKKSCVVNSALPERRKSMVARHTSIPVIKSRLSQHEADSGAVSSQHTPEIIKREITVPRKKFEVSLKEGPSSENRLQKKGKQSSSAVRQSSSYNSVDSDQNTKKVEKRMSYSPLKISTPLNSQQLKARRSSSVAGSQPEKSKLSSSKKSGGSIKETLCTNTGTIKSSKIKISPYSIQVAGGPDGSNQKRDEGKISNVKTKLSSSSSQSARTVDERGKKSESLKSRNNMAAFTSSANKTLASNRSSLGKTATIKPKIVGSLKVVSPPVKEENRIMVKTEVGKTSDENVPEKTLHVVEVQTTANLSESTEGMDMTPPLSPCLSPPQGMSSSCDEEVKVLGVDPYPHESNMSPVLTHQQGMVMSLSDHEEVGAGGKEVLLKGHMEDEVEPEAGEVEETQEKEKEKEEEEEDTIGEKVEEEQQLQHREVGEEEEMETEEDSDDDDDEAEEEEENMYESDGDEGDEFINCDETIHHSGVEKIHCKPLKKGYILSDSGVPMHVKLKFRRGKVMDIQSENTGPRRLRFRQRRIVEENHTIKNDVTRRNFNRRYDSKGNNNNNTNEEKIVLRHQDSQGRKDGQGLLLNNVIEETASKLVETRKSKVKALVGAFETVISLQDSKPSVQLVV